MKISTESKSPIQGRYTSLSYVIQLVQLMVQLMVQPNYIIISYLYIGPRCLSKFITLAPTSALCKRDKA